jgi:hypothetical protein
MIPYNPQGQAVVTAPDLYDLELDCGKILPWLSEVLQEVQYFRDLMDDDDGLVVERIKYLEGVLDKLGATYDETTD